METQDTYFETLKRQVVSEGKQFTSGIPLAGPLAVKLRNAWNNLLAKWRLLQRQSQVNSMLVGEIRQQALRVDHEAVQLAEIDRTQMASQRETAVLAAQVRRLNAQLRLLEERVAELEEAHGGAETG